MLSRLQCMHQDRKVSRQQAAYHIAVPIQQYQAWHSRYHHAAAQYRTSHHAVAQYRTTHSGRVARYTPSTLCCMSNKTRMAR
eukprot:103538-Rhodomonas_salina.2